MEATIMYDLSGRQEQIRRTSSADGMHPLHPSSIIVDDSGGKENASLGGLRRGIQELRDKMAAGMGSGEVKVREPVTELKETDQEPKQVANGDEDKEDVCYRAEEFDVGLGDKLRLVDLSARAIEVLNEVTMRCSWCTCSRNTYGFLVRNLLLRGSIFENQLVEDTSKLLFLSFTGVFFSASMQFILAYYLFLKMPGYFGSIGEEKERSFASATEDPLPSYQYPAVMYQNQNDVCRTEQIVQIICIGLFLFYVLNNIPGIIKNALIIARSQRFISKDEEDITKLHYWRESDYSRRLDEGDEVCAEFINSINQGTASDEKFCFKCCNQLQRVKFENDSHLCKRCGDRIKKDGAANRCERCNFDLCANCFVSSGKTRMREKYALPHNQFAAHPGIAAIPRPAACQCENLPQTFFDVTDARNFLGEVLEELEVDKREQVKDLSFADKAKVSLVCVDYLRPNVDTFPSWTIFVPFFNYLQDFGLFKACSARLDQALKLAANVGRDRAGENGRDLESPVVETSKVSMEVLYKRNPRQFKDLPYFVELFPFNFRFVLCRWLAFIFGVLPEFITLVMITITGIQYILWSGYKIDSDSRGIEEIILATVAITFIYDIDEAIYDHILPEFYKDAHERDQFELIGWIPLASSKQLSLVLSWDYNRRMLNFSWQRLSHKFFGTDVPHLHINFTESESEHGQSTDNQKKRFLRVVKDKWQRQHGTAKKVPQWDDKIPMSEDAVLALSADKKYNDFYLALQYPFLYAKKLRFIVGVHLWQKFLVFYSTRGIHYFLLLALTLAIVGKYRTMAQCNRFAPKGWDRNAQSSIWATQEWPTTCLMATGTATPVGSKVTDLYQNVNGMVVPVSCVKKGYLPDQEEELAALEESGYANDMSTIPAPSE